MNSKNCDNTIIQDIFNIKLTGIDSYKEDRIASRVTSYRVIAAHSELTGKLDENKEARGWFYSSIVSATTFSQIRLF